jgi:hypothetical protein
MLVRLTRSPDEWKDEPLTARWQSSGAFPPEVAALLNTNDATEGAALLLAIPQHETPLARGSHAAAADLCALGRTSHGLISIVVDAISGDKGSDAADDTSARGRTRSAAALCALLEIDPQRETDVSARFIHRTAVALIEARRFFAVAAVVIVDSVTRTQDSFDDFRRFVALMGGRLRAPGHLAPVAPREGIHLLFGWAQG